MLIYRLNQILEPLKQRYIYSKFTRKDQMIDMSRYMENGVVRSKRIMIQSPQGNKYMEAQYDKNGKYIKNSFFSSTNTVARNLDIVG